MSRVIRLLKDNTYQLLEVSEFEPFKSELIHQGSLQEIEAYLALEERGLL